MDINEFYQGISLADLILLKNYLLREDNKRTLEKKFSVVFDITHSCGLNCVGCGTNAIQSGELKARHNLCEIKEIEIACRKIKEFADTNKEKVFINLGGGEPFLRKDIIDIIKIIHSFFDSDGVGIDTSASLDCSQDKIKDALPYLSYIGISINGLMDYQNWWTQSKHNNVFKKQFDTLAELCQISEAQKKIEVTSVATKKNIKELPELMRILSKIGVQRYSIHRAIPVGRMAEHMDIIPDAHDYLELLISMIKMEEKTGVEFHIHHTIEDIHRALLFDKISVDEKKYGEKSKASSIGISPEGEVVFSPWCMVGNWIKLSCGNIFDEKSDLEKMISNQSTDFFKVNELIRSDIRCKGCQVNCTGGSRISAAATEMKERGISESFCSKDLHMALSAMDPACPLYPDSRVV